jgi:ABC-2 type transport system ATP-binding protein
MEDNIAIRINHVSKYFKLPTEPTNSLRRAVVNRFKGIKGYRKQEVLKDISFDIEKGDFFGIVGRNGSGKSTLLKIISKIYKPNSGSVEINGRLVSFIELGVGFNDELSGRENVYLNGAMLGFSTEEIDEMYDEIVEFSELQDFMDQKLKNYSSGMQVRLAFSVAIMAKGDILVLDEVLAVGDEAFQRKCNEFFYSTKKSGKTIVLVTHSMEAVRQFCNKAVMIQDGEIVASGNPDRVASAYSKMFQKEYVEQVSQADSPVEGENEKGLNEVELTSVSVLQKNNKKGVVNFRENFSIALNLYLKNNYEDLVFGVHIINKAGQAVTALSTKSVGGLNLKTGDVTLMFELENIFSEGEYYLNIAGGVDHGGEQLLKEYGVGKFVIVGMDQSLYSLYGLTYPTYKIEVK